MKYIRIDVENKNLISPLVIAFPNDLCHIQVAEALEKVCKESWPQATVSTVSAGDISLSVLSTSGWSSSMNLHSKPEDYAFLPASDYGAHRIIKEPS